MKNTKRKSKRTSFVNVKIPEFVTNIIDRNLGEGKLLQTEGYVGRAQFVQTMVFEKLSELNLLTQEETTEIERLEKKRKRHGRH